MSLDIHTGYVGLDVSKAGIDISDADAAVGDVKSPKTFYSVAPPRKTGTMPTKAIVAGSDAYEEGYHAGDPGGLDAIDTDLAPGNIREGVTIFGKLGTLAAAVGIDMPAIMGALGIVSTPDFQNFAKPCAVGNPNAEAIVGVDQSHNEDAPIASEYDTSVV